MGVKFPASEEMNDKLYITIMTIINTVSLCLTVVKICMYLDCFLSYLFLLCESSSAVIGGN